MQSKNPIQLAVIGGGAAGFMGAIKAAEDGVNSVVIFEGKKKTLEKVRISGGGRCNVTHACWDPKELVPNYPRGEIPLLGAFSRFATGDAVEWFSDRGLQLIQEEDGRMFPQSNSSNDVIDCLKQAAKNSGVISYTETNVISIKYLGAKGFEIATKQNNYIYASKVLLATGGDPSGYKIASELGHKIISAAPSLFSLKIVCPRLNSCAGISVDNLNLKLKAEEETFSENGRILITHRGLSGPAILRLTAFAARKLQSVKYKALLEINWSNKTEEYINQLLQSNRQNNPSKTLSSSNPLEGIPKRVWLYFLNQVEISSNKRWAGLSKKEEKMLSNLIRKDSHKITGKGPYGEEFVTAGGVSLNQINFRSMESRICKGLYFAGEVINVDGVTGGFNFQHCWTSGWIAGRQISKDLNISV